MKILQSILCVIALSIGSYNSFAQHDFKFHISGITEGPVYLANYYGGKMYYNDTTEVKANGLVEFNGPDTKP